MKLRIATPAGPVFLAEDVASLRAEDASGGFGIQPGHVDCLTVLPPSLLVWTSRTGGRMACAVRGGVLSVRDGDLIAVSAREAVVSDNPDELEHTVLHDMRSAADQERRARVESLHLQVNAIRNMVLLMQKGLMPSGWGDQ